MLSHACPPPPSPPRRPGGPTYPTAAGWVLRRRLPDRYSAAALCAELAGEELAALDMETTGLQVARRWADGPRALDRPTQVAVLPVEPGGAPVRGLCGLIDPGRPIGAEVAALTGICDARVAGAPPWVEMLPRIVSAIGDRVVVVHHGGFDIEMLRDMIETVQDPARAHEMPPGTEPVAVRADLAAMGANTRQWLPPGGVVDTRALSRAVFGPSGRGPGGAPRRAPGDPADDRLATLVRHYGIAAGAAHDAEADARATAALLRHLLDDALRRGTVFDHQAELEGSLGALGEWD